MPNTPKLTYREEELLRYFRKTGKPCDQIILDTAKSTFENAAELRRIQRRKERNKGGS